MVNTQTGWYQAEAGVVVESAERGAFQALLDEAFFACQCGGMITIQEVPIDEVRQKVEVS